MFLGRISGMSELRDIESTEFFYDNMEMVGFENPARALVISVKEAVDNAIDACEDLEVLPEIDVTLRDRDPEDEIDLIVRDNAGGIPPGEIENVFGQVLYSSRFGRWRQTRGQQGIGISAVFLWSQKWIGEPTRVTTRRPGEDAHRFEISAERKGEQIQTHSADRVDVSWDHGTEIEIPIRATWQSLAKVRAYLEGTALANPSAQITATIRGEQVVWERTDESPPDPPGEMRPYPEAASIGMLEKMVDETDSQTVGEFLGGEFSQIGRGKRRQILRRADISDDRGLDLSKSAYQRLVEAMRDTDYRSPTDDALSPLGDELVEQTLELYTPAATFTETRNLTVIDGHPTIVEVGIAWGGDLTETRYHRVANRVPLVYDGNACALRDATTRVSWGLYDMDETDRGLPDEPIAVFVHVCSTAVQFGNEAKTYVASNDELEREIKLALESCGRDLKSHLRAQRRRREQRRKVEKMTPVYRGMEEKLSEITGRDTDPVPAIGTACNTVVIDEDREIVYNPTDQTRTVTIGDRDVTLDPGEQTDWDGEVEYGHYPVRV